MKIGGALCIILSTLWLIYTCKKDETPDPKGLSSLPVEQRRPMIQIDSAKRLGDTAYLFNAVIINFDKIPPLESCGFKLDTLQQSNNESSVFNVTNFAGNTFSIITHRVYTNRTNYLLGYATNKYGKSYSVETVFIPHALLPVLNQLDVQNIKGDRADFGFVLESNGGDSIISCGLCFDTLPNPDIYSDSVRIGVGGENITGQMQNLLPNKQYYSRAYASNSIGIRYSQQKSFNTTVIALPIVLTGTAGNISLNFATLNGTISTDGNGTVSTRGFCWATSQNPTLENHHTTEVGQLGDFSNTITELTGHTVYYFRAYAINQKGISYGDQKSFSTNDYTFALVSTSSASAISFNEASAHGVVINEGNSPVMQRGFCYSLSNTPDISGNLTSNGGGPGNFESSFTNLQSFTTYYVRAYAINFAGVAYGDVLFFKTHALTLAILSTSSITNINTNSAISGGFITNEGNTPVTQRGVCWSTSQNPTTSDNHIINGTGSGNYSATLTNLTPNTTYFVRAFATNSAGTAYGSQLSFTTLALTKPTVSTTEITQISISNATGGGNVTSSGNNPLTARGICWSTTSNPNINSNHTSDGALEGIFTSILSGLSPNTIYYVKAYASNQAGTAYGQQVEFTTLANVTTNPVTNITSLTATCGGNVPSKGKSSGIITAKGVCWATTANPSLSNSYTNEGPGTGSFVSQITGLNAATSYYVRAYATNSTGTSYGNQIVFTTANANTVIDADGNIYNTITIGNQVWLKENLKVTHYRDGSVIPSESGGSSWANLTTGAYCIYNNVSENYATYGSLYNWFCVTDNRNICPIGWHVSSNIEWDTLVEYLGGASVAGGKLKEIGFEHWNSPNTGATNETGFTALPGGACGSDGTFGYLGAFGNWWTTYESNPNDAAYRFLFDYQNIVEGNYGNKKHGFSVRCIQDESPLNVPTVTTGELSSINNNSAICNGNVTNDGGASVTSKGVCWSMSPDPTTNDNHTNDGTGTGEFVSEITGLSANTTYYVRAYATNSAGTAYGNQVSFETLNANQISDIDGNIYNTVTIGSQVWMKENLKVTHFQNGDEIPLVSDNSLWSQQTLGAYCYFENDINNLNTYGAMYNWYTASDSRNVCPAGWEIPNSNDWLILINHLGGQSVAGGALKSVSGWAAPNIGATNSSGFTGLPGGYRLVSGDFFSLFNVGGWWAKDEASSISGMQRNVYSNTAEVEIGDGNKKDAISIRCLKIINSNKF